jgi:Bacterial Ig-like domain (group 2)
MSVIGWRAFALGCLVLFLLFPGCGGNGSTSTEPPPVKHAAALTIVGGNNQTGTSGASLSQILVVRVDDQSAQPFAGATVNWAITGGGGSVDQASSVTGTEGTASVHWTLGTQAGANGLSASTGPLAPVAFAATGLAGPFAKIAISNPQASVQAGDLIQLSAQATDNYGNPVSPPLFTWMSSANSVATVTSAGFLTVRNVGSVSISASGGGITGSLPFAITTGITFSFGTEETVFSWTTDSCESLDVPDVPAHAVRLADGTLMLADGDAPRNYAMFGADFSSLQRNCSVTLASDDDSTAQSFDNQEWIHSVYREGSVIHALIHNEFHDPIAPNCSPGNSSPGNPCWYNSISYASSTDGGHTFTHATPPGQLVAPSPVAWDPQGPPPAHGYFNPSNLVFGQDSFFYSIFMAIDRAATQQGLCVMRTKTLADPTSWRAWDGSGFNLQMTDPYTTLPTAMCTIVVPAIWGSLTFNTYLNKYMLVGEGLLGGGSGPFVCGIGYSLSSDLVTWAPIRFVREQTLPFFPPCSATSGATAYPSIIDHADATTNFERPGRTPHLYFTRFNDLALNRDLVRVPLTITLH